ncbi:nitrous oxide reductase accessory protein NosL [Bacillus sp. HMF5848]|uniref:nitrous oxide reductase accessory protein NosL n=1 Tax=Bacillus sp. HMF5848 TaxID=2495421 RepID=UPI0021AE1165|nr:nitrous oxide reductase accessory protein NosL [Bacillus sp. HMF5848]
MRKKLFLTISLVLIALILGACGQDDTTTMTTSHDPTEPHDESTCAFCNMKIYLKDDEMGVFTAQAITEDGKTLFFDDSGCLLNYERKDDALALETKWVRDYVSQEWLKAGDASIAHADIKTPMKYGYVFFSSDQDAKDFVTNNANLNAKSSSWEDIDAVSKERFMKKMGHK